MIKYMLNNMTELQKIVLKNNLKISLENKLNINNTIINKIWDDLDKNSSKSNEKIYFELLNIYEKENIEIYKILYDI